nr:hypothetical protein [Streptomonospora nanhaiensis]
MEEAAVSYEERRVWVYGLVALVVPVGYFGLVMAQVPGTAVADIGYVVPMLVAIGVALPLNMLFGPRQRARLDERDAAINRHGEHIGFYVLAAVTAAALGLTMAGVPHFWIANVLYLGFVLNALTASAAKIVAYRRGL